MTTDLLSLIDVKYDDSQIDKDFFDESIWIIYGYTRLIIFKWKKMHKLMPRDVALLCVMYLGDIGLKDNLKATLQIIQDDTEIINKYNQRIRYMTYDEFQTMCVRITEIMDNNHIKLMQRLMEDERIRILKQRPDYESIKIFQFNNLSLKFQDCIENCQAALNTFYQTMNMIHMRRIELLLGDHFLKEMNLNSIEDIVSSLNGSLRDYKSFLSFMVGRLDWVDLIDRVESCVQEMGFIVDISEYIDQLTEIYHDITIISKEEIVKCSHTHCCSIL